MADQAESSRGAPPMTPPPPPPPSPATHGDKSSEAIMWAASDDSVSSTPPHTDLLSLWLVNYTTLPKPEAKEEPLTDVPTLLNFDLESSFPDLVDWNTTRTAVTQAPVVTQPLWMQLHASDESEVDDLSRLGLGIQSPKASILPLALGIQSPNGIQFPEASVSPLALGIIPSPVSFEIQPREAPMSSLALRMQPPPASSGIEAPPASISSLPLGFRPPQAPISFGTQSPHFYSGIQPPQARKISPLAPEIQSSILPLARGIRSPPISFGIQSAPIILSSLPSIPCTLPKAPPSWNFGLPSPSPVPERRSWSVFPSTPPPPVQRQLLLLPHSTSASMSSPCSHQPRHFFPAANTGYQQQLPVAHAPVTFSTPNANANFFAGHVPASRPSWSQAVAPRRSWTPNQSWISNGQAMQLPIPRCQRFLLPPGAATTPAPFPLLAYFGNSVGNTPSWTVRGDTPARDHQRVERGESSRPSRKRSKLVVRTC